jgi:hypothetical protein
VPSVTSLQDVSRADPLPPRISLNIIASSTQTCSISASLSPTLLPQPHAPPSASRPSLSPTLLPQPHAPPSALHPSLSPTPPIYLLSCLLELLEIVNIDYQPHGIWSLLRSITVFTWPLH